MLKKKNSYKVAVVGATGAVGNCMLSILEERKFPVSELIPLASAKSVGKTLRFQEKDLSVRELKEDSFEGVDIALFSAGGGISKQFSPIAAKSGCVVVDNSSAFRMEADVPLVVPEVNPHALKEHSGIIANPNCSTIQMVVALKPVHERYKIKKVVVSTYQSVSGSGQKAINELEQQTRSQLQGEELECKVYPHPIAFNCLPHIDAFLENGFTKEEMKMVNETHKILEDSSIQVCPTTVRVPVFYSHSEAIYVETENDVAIRELKTLLAESPGLQVVDDPASNTYPQAINAAHKDAVMVGRIRADLSGPKAFHFWVVADNLRKGAALNAIQIAELLVG